MSQEANLEELARQLSGIALLAGCAAMSVPRRSPRPTKRVLPMVKPAPPVREKLSPEVREFKSYPRDMQKQALAYLRKWQEGVSQ
ncbi:hypothetical protein ACFLXC_03210 [Chloroflexota bacterium]